MLFDGLDHFGFRHLAPVGHTKCTVIGVATGAAGNLGHFSSCQAAHLPTVKLHVGGQRHMPEIEIQAHSDGIGGDQEVDITILIKLDLGVAGARAEPPHHHRRATTLAAHQLGNLIDIGNPEGDDGAAARQSCQLLRPGKAELREPPARLEARIREHLAQQRTGGLGAKEHRFMDAAGMQDTISEDVATLTITGKLHLVHRDKIIASPQPIIIHHRRAAKRHRFNSAAQIARAGWQNPFLSGDQADLRGTKARHQTVVILTRQKPQRKADHTAGIAGHPFQREMRLAGIGRAENHRHPAVTLGAGVGTGRAWPG